MKREKELAVLFLYFVIEEMLLGGLVLPLLKEHISLEGFHAFSLLAHLFLLVIVLLICFPFAVKQADIFMEKPGINVFKSLSAAVLILAVQALIGIFLRNAEIASANQQALAQIDKSDGLMAENGILVVEHGADENDVPQLDQLKLVHNRRYGHTTQLSFFQWRSYVEAEEEEE